MKHKWRIQVETWPLLGNPNTQQTVAITVESNANLALDGVDASQIARDALVNTDYVCREAFISKIIQ